MQSIGRHRRLMSSFIRSGVLNLSQVVRSADHWRISNDSSSVKWPVVLSGALNPTHSVTLICSLSASRISYRMWS